MKERAWIKLKVRGEKINPKRYNIQFHNFPISTPLPRLAIQKLSPPLRGYGCEENESRPRSNRVTLPNMCSVAVVSSVVVMSSHLITNRMRFYFFQSKCVVNVSSACHFPTRGGMQCKIVRLSLSFPRSKFENFMGYSCFMGLSLMPFGTLRIVERLIFLLRF